LTWFFIKHHDTAANSLSGSANTGDVTEDQAAANDLLGQGAQMVCTLKMILIFVEANNSLITHLLQNQKVRCRVHMKPEGSLPCSYETQGCV
jgi:hypothetical protein